jgi:hypothetical protein
MVSYALACGIKTLGASIAGAFNRWCIQSLVHSIAGASNRVQRQLTEIKRDFESAKNLSCCSRPLCGPPCAALFSHVPSREEGTLEVERVLKARRTGTRTEELDETMCPHDKGKPNASIAKRQVELPTILRLQACKYETRVRTYL